ncbi:MAG: hypothetical protein K9K62_08185 [Desulfobacteraceae bacterium]|nr:hypothetical protein [Desulfobacteraceae bacterium]
MKILHILRSEPDETVERLIGNMSDKDDETTVKSLYKKEIDWQRLVDDIFSHEKIICWW